MPRLFAKLTDGLSEKPGMLAPEHSSERSTLALSRRGTELTPTGGYSLKAADTVPIWQYQFAGTECPSRIASPVGSQISTTPDPHIIHSLSYHAHFTDIDWHNYEIIEGLSNVLFERRPRVVARYYKLSFLTNTISSFIAALGLGARAHSSHPLCMALTQWKAFRTVKDGSKARLSRVG